MPSGPGPDLLALRHGDDRVVLDPRQGGAIREYTHRGCPVLRTAPVDAGSDPFAYACFPLVPYANRIAHGRLKVGSRNVQLPPNWSGDRHPLHGQGWRRPWEVVDASVSEATLQILGGGDAWPWAYRAEQRFELSGQGLRVQLSVDNLSSEPMPAILGFHPYFPDARGARLLARTPRVWMADAEALPVTEVPTPREWSFESGRPVAGPLLDHCFGGWDGTAVLRWPDRTVTLRSSCCQHLHVYVPPHGDFFCIEPQTAAAGALSREDGGRALVPSGGRLTMDMSLAPGGP